MMPGVYLSQHSDVVWFVAQNIDDAWYVTQATDVIQHVSRDVDAVWYVT